MLIRRRPMAAKTLTLRIDDEMDSGIRNLAVAVRADVSTVARLAVAELLIRAKAMNPTNVEDLVSHES
jgi:predicted transcriptional regulator